MGNSMSNAAMQTVAFDSLDDFGSRRKSLLCPLPDPGFRLVLGEHHISLQAKKSQILGRFVAHIYGN